MALKISKNRQAYFNQVAAERVWGSGVPSQILGVYQLYLLKCIEMAGWKVRAALSTSSLEPHGQKAHPGYPLHVPVSCPPLVPFVKGAFKSVTEGFIQYSRTGRYFLVYTHTLFAGETEICGYKTLHIMKWMLWLSKELAASHNISSTPWNTNNLRWSYDYDSEWGIIRLDLTIFCGSKHA